MKDPDLYAIVRLQHGDASALRELYDRYGSLLYSVAHRIVRSDSDAEDVVQESWVYAWKRASTYDPGRCRVLSWLVLITRSRALDRYRSMSSRSKAETTAEAHANPRSPSDPAVVRQLRERVAEGLETLPAEQREALEIAFFEGLSHSQIAERLETPLGTIKTRIRQGLQRLGQSLPKEDWA